MTNGTVYSAELKAEVREQRASGLALSAIANVHGIPHGTLRGCDWFEGLNIPSQRNDLWSQERIEQLKILWARGLTCAQIGVQLGITRNAVVGKVHRLKLGSRITAPRISRPRKERTASLVRKTDRRKQLRALNSQHTRRKQVFGFIEVGTDLATTHADNPRSIFELGRFECRWPCEGDGYNTVFCGGECGDGLSYCSRHASLAYRPAR